VCAHRRPPRRQNACVRSHGRSLRPGPTARRRAHRPPV
jgi:hypothetical protein